jgi:phospholipid/cholesterol/gamma-HCH transport system substrate-binding protein
MVTVRVGALIAGAIAILCFAIFSIGHGSRFLRRTDFLQAHFQRINGLQTGAPVTLAGVRIGAVDSIRFPANPRADYVMVTMWIDDWAFDRVRTDSVAQISTIGLLGDKFVELTPGTPTAASVKPGAVIAARNPIDYAALLQKKGTSDLIANVMAITQSMRSLLQEVEKGHGLLAALIKGEPGHPEEPNLTLDDIRGAFASMERLSTQVNTMVGKINRGEGLAGAMLSNQVNGRRLLANVDRAAVSMNATSHKLDALIDRLNRAQGVVPRLLEDRQYANALLGNVQQSSEDLRRIMRKIDSGRGTIGLAVNDPALYNEAKRALAPQGSVGWGLRVMNAMYGLTHPFSGGSSQTPGDATQPITLSRPNGAQGASNPRPVGAALQTPTHQPPAAAAGAAH